MKKKMLVTGFQPFDGGTINPSWEAVKRLPDSIGDYDVIKREIPVVFGTGAEEVIRIAEAMNVDAVLCVGLAAGRKSITPELVGINYRRALRPDNAGQSPKGEPIVVGGPDGLFSTLPVETMVDAIKENDIPAALSFSAGSFVCNDCLYTVLEHFNGTSVRAGFIHVPAHEPDEEGKIPWMPLDRIIRGLTVAIEAC